MKHIRIIILFVSLGCAPLVTHAAEVELIPSEVKLRVGDPFHVDLTINTDESINAIEGALHVPPNLLAIQEIHDGDSVINFWLAKSQHAPSGTITFSGITPGGFLGPKSHVLSFVFTPQAVGTATIDWNTIMLLKNDGLGSRAEVQYAPLVLDIVAGDSSPQVDTLVDTEPPENFVPMVALGIGADVQQSMLIFATQDKISGVKSYAVREYWLPQLKLFSRWHQAQSPYALRDQKGRSYIEVKALDFASNARIATLAPSHPLDWYEIMLPPVILLLVTIIVVRRVWRRKQKRS